MSASFFSSLVSSFTTPTVNTQIETHNAASTDLSKFQFRETEEGGFVMIQTCNSNKAVGSMTEDKSVDTQVESKTVYALSRQSIIAANRIARQLQAKQNQRQLERILFPANQFNNGSQFIDVRLGQQCGVESIHARQGYGLRPLNTQVHRVK